MATKPSWKADGYFFIMSNGHDEPTGESIIFQSMYQELWRVRILFYLQANKVTCHNFMEADG